MSNQQMQQNNSELNQDLQNSEPEEAENKQTSSTADIQWFKDIIEKNKLKNSQTNPIENSMSEQEPKEPNKAKNPYLEPKYVFSGTELLNMPVDNTPHLWEPIIFKQGLMALTGSSDVGKSSFLRDLAIAIVLKETSFLDHPLNAEHGKVIYYTTEENQSSISACLKKQSARIGKKDLSGLKYIFSIENPWDTILRELNKGPVDAVIIDCFADVIEGNLNINGDVRSYLQQISELSVAKDTLFILLHHNGKRTEYNAPSKNSMIGSQGFEAKVRLVLEIRKEGDTSRSLWITKGNHLPESMKKKGMQLNFDENQHFTYVGKKEYVPATNNNKFFDTKEIMLARIIEILGKEKKISYDKILLKLKLEYPENAPSKGTLCNWIKEIKSNGNSKAA